MGTTIATINSTQMPGCTSFGEREQEMATVLSRYLPSFRRRAFQYLGNVADAEDAVQDALLSAYKHVDQFGGHARMSTWLTAIVINSARMHLRRRPRQTHVSLDEHLGPEGYTLSELLPHYGPSPEEQCRRSDLARNVLQLVQQLSPTLCTAFQLRHLQGLTIREIANTLEVAEGTVKARVARASAKLRSLMRKKVGNERRHISMTAAPARAPARKIV
jgi:RNA polymerase sigma-70 factor (ECF subfamily)